MPPSGLAIIIGAGPSTGIGIARIFSSPSHGNMAVALLARRPESLSKLKSSLLEGDESITVETFVSDTSPQSIQNAFIDIKNHQSFKNLKLEIAVYSIKHASKKPFLEETHESFTKSLDEYVGGAMIFAQESIKRFFVDHGQSPLADGAEMKGTLIFTGTLGAMRTNAEYSAYGAGRAGVRMLAQGLAKEYSAQGIHVVHAIMNGAIVDQEGDDQLRGKKMSANAVGLEYLHLAGQQPTVWTHELDMRPAQERF